MTAVPRPLFVDTAPLYAHFDRSAPRHDRAARVVEAIADHDRQYRPVYTTTYVVDELAALTLSRRDHATAAEAIERVRSSTLFEIVSPTVTDFDAACEAFLKYDDAGLSLTDHMIGVLADDRDVDHVLTFDRDHFRTLGFTVVPADTGEP